MNPAGIVDVEILFNTGDGEKIEKRSYFEKTDADKYIYNSKLKYILSMFSRYVFHSKILMETGICRAFYQTESRCISMDKCVSAEKWFRELDLLSICRYILKIENHLRNILPSPGNKSYESSKNKMYDIIVFARNEVEKTLTSSIK